MIPPQTFVTLGGVTSIKHILWALIALAWLLPAADLERIKYNHPGLVVDLGVGLWAWPMPVDWDGDGDLDLLVDCPCKPYNGIWFFENPGDSKTPVFKAGKRVHASRRNIQVSWVNGKRLQTNLKIYPVCKPWPHLLQSKGYLPMTDKSRL